MARVIWKFPLEVTDQQVLEIPCREGATPEFLCVQTQRDTPCLWVKVDPTAGRRKYRVYTFGTGHPLDENGSHPYIGTYQVQGGYLVFHVHIDMLAR